MKIRQETLFSHMLPTQKLSFFGVICLCLLLALLVAGGNRLEHSASLRVASAQGHARPVVLPTAPATPAVAPVIQITQTLARQYMNALLTHNYQAMWAVLDPTIRAKWTDEAAFAAFWHARFAGYTLERFSLGQVRPLSFWVDPETMQQYTNLEEVPISLQLKALAIGAWTGAAPPEVQNPSVLYRNVPLIVHNVSNTIDSDGDNDSASDGVWYVLVGGPADLEAPLLPPLTPPDNRVQVPILMYHHISDTNPQPNPFYWNVTVEHFQQQMDYLVAHGYHAITFNQLFDALYYGLTLPSRPVLLTFDDGREDAYQNAYPILVAHHFSGMFYIPTGWVGEAGQMTWGQLREMLAHGMQMGAHTIDHVDFQILLRTSPTESQRQLQQSKQALEQQLGIVIQHFCYPYGEPFYLGTRYEQQQIVQMLASDGYIDATVAVGVVSGIVQTSQAPFALPRVPVFGFENIYSFALRLPWH